MKCGREGCYNVRATLMIIQDSGGRSSFVSRLASIYNICCEKRHMLSPMRVLSAYLFYTVGTYYSQSFQEFFFTSK